MGGSPPHIVAQGQIQGAAWAFSWGRWQGAPVHVGPGQAPTGRTEGSRGGGRPARSSRRGAGGAGAEKPRQEDFLEGERPRAVGGGEIAQCPDVVALAPRGLSGLVLHF